MLDLVLINGLPGSGKSTLAAGLAPVLEAPLIGKDAIKEAVAGVVSAAPRRALGIAASEMMWTLTSAMSGTVILESWWFRPRDLQFVEAGLRRCDPATVVELWCRVPAGLAKSRYATRRRHPIHDDERQLVDAWPRREREAAPLGLSPVVLVDTGRPVDMVDLVGRIKRAKP
jgi:predicted kinase